MCFCFAEDFEADLQSPYLQFLISEILYMQDKFRWTGSLEGGVEQMALTKLKQRAAKSMQKKRFARY